MAKVNKIRGFRVVITAERPIGGFKDMHQARNAADRLVLGIERHIDGFAECVVETVSDEFCQFCGSNWTASNSNYNGGCCDADEDAHDAAMAARSKQTAAAFTDKVQDTIRQIGADSGMPTPQHEG